MNALTKINGNVPSVFAGQTNLPDMNAAAQAGVQASFAIVGYRGKNWRIKYRGEEQVILDARGVPDAVIDVVVVGVSPGLSKQYYEKKYSEGDDAAPDCFSVDGITPDAASPKKQCASCATCPMNAFGSRITEAGKKAKACQDSKRIVVVPAADIENSGYGGPMMLRIPAMSLANFSKYTGELHKFNAQPYMVKTRLGFDMDAAYPRLTFAPAGWVTDADDAAKIVDAIQDPQVERILNTEAVTLAPAAQVEPEASPLSGGPPAHFQQLAAPVVAPPAPAPVVVAEPVVEEDDAEEQAALAALTAARLRKAEAAAAKLAAAEKPVTTQELSPEDGKPATKPATVVQQAPSDMEAALDSLLDS